MPKKKKNFFSFVNFFPKYNFDIQKVIGIESEKKYILDFNNKVIRKLRSNQKYNFSIFLRPPTFLYKASLKDYGFTKKIKG